MSEAKEQFEKGMSREEFKERVLADETFSGKLGLLDTTAEPGNLKDFLKIIRDYGQDTDDQLTKDTQDGNSIMEDFEKRWDGTKGEYGQMKGGLANTAKIQFSWMKSALERMIDIQQRKEARLTQAMALYERCVDRWYDELARLYGDPKAALGNLVKEIQVQDGIIKKLAAQNEKIMGQMKLGKNEGKTDG